MFVGVDTAGYREDVGGYCSLVYDYCVYRCSERYSKTFERAGALAHCSRKPQCFVRSSVMSGYSRRGVSRMFAGANGYGKSTEFRFTGYRELEMQRGYYVQH